jgi:hypothetical protein
MRPSPPLSDAAWRAALFGMQGEFRPDTTLQVMAQVGVPFLTIGSLLVAIESGEFW